MTTNENVTEFQKQVILRFRALPLPTPLLATGEFGEFRQGTAGVYPHSGIDLKVTENTQVYAVADGVVTVWRNGGFGLYIDIAHRNGLSVTRYAHLNSVRTKNGTFDTVPGTCTNTRCSQIESYNVKAGDVIARSGGAIGNPNAGQSKGAHLHLELYERNSVIEPLNRSTLKSAEEALEALYGRQIPFVGNYTRLENGRVVTLGNQEVGGIDPTNPSSGQSTPSAPARATAISPYIASLESLHPNIQYELTRRAYASETANAYMPFIRLTSLSKVLNKHLSNPGSSPSTPNEKVYCPTLGPHGHQPRIDFEDIYIPRGNRSIFGYAMEEQEETGYVIPTPLFVEQSSAEEVDAPNIPMPGIVSMTTERSTAGAMGTRGGLFKANLKIQAHSVGQLNALLVYFLRPATRVVLEFGRISSNNEESITPFQWNRPLDDIINKEETITVGNTDKKIPSMYQLITGNASQEEFIRKYVYGNNGNYDIFIGYVVNFKTNYTKNNVYEIDLTIHSIQQFEVPTKFTGAQSLCQKATATSADGVIDIEDYFRTKEFEKTNGFTKLLNATLSATNGSQLSSWKPHVVKLLGTGETAGGYLLTWQFFTDVVLNDPELGILSIFKNNRKTTSAAAEQNNKNFELLQRSLLPMKDDVFLELQPTKLVNSQVGWHKSLRSTRPEVMIIHNPRAGGGNCRLTDSDRTRILNTLKNSVNDEGRKIETKLKEFTFTRISGDESGTGDASGLGSLYNGVWIHSNAIQTAFQSADTLTVALTRLLNEMNSATEGYWNLQLLSDDTISPGIHVVDMGLSKEANKNKRPDTDRNSLPTRESFALSNDSNDGKDRPQFLYEFNRKIQRFGSSDIGSELLDVKLESSLPQVIAIQAIAGVGGIAQAGTWEAIKINELKDITLFPQVYPSCEEAEANNGTCPKDAAFAEISKVGAASVEVAAQTYGRIYGAGGDLGQLFAQLFVAQAAEQQEAFRQFPVFASFAKKYVNTFGAGAFLAEYDKALMLKELSTGVEGSPIHSFNSSNLTKTTVDLTLPGIGGVQLFQSFTVARVPNILNRGYYIVTKVAHEFTVNNGWITKIQGRFRYVPDRVSNPVTGNEVVGIGGSDAGPRAISAPSAPSDSSFASSQVTQPPP